ncbi:hypothetical protein PYCCODRAFT_1393850 [Trametes coccinea BRFM310]|uniref:Fungal-type protein kinase domain-containing protein n=1 Tax=Trametes coccinea (strain BRFM310) TaxID=1353009 RepID=A0A1Y2IIZ7_TRAC3|nr:hypothetical protein PYCCODRAFT_1393850 [Trametes coccinea BRFM310]
MDKKVVITDYNKFMERFVPPPGGVASPSQAQYAGVHLEEIPQKPESAMYPELMEKLNTPWLAPGFRFVDTSSKPDESSLLRVDGGMYPAADAPEQNKNTDWSTIEVFIECKTESTSGDPFDDTRSGGLPQGEERRKTFGQVLTYCYSIFKAQHRTHLFNVVVFGTNARISRLDRSGLVVTKKFNHKTEPEKLLEFFWRLARLSAEERGHDASAVPVVAGSREYRIMQSRAGNPRRQGKHKLQEHARLAFQQSLEGARWWKLKVDDESNPSAGPRYFLVGNPHFAASKAVIGRATRGFVAIDLKDPKGPFVYLKDAWRVAHEGIDKEGEILGYLNAEGVHNVPTMVCHGDVLPPPFQSTSSHEVWEEENPGVPTCPLKKHRHYRLVVKEVCLPMHDFKTGKELVRLMADCIGAHASAYSKGILHRDISAGNVLIYVNEHVDKQGKLRKERLGFLTDWELSKGVVEEPAEDAPRQPDRTGTWQFLSVQALLNPNKKIGIEDEMESFFHVLLYYALRYLPSNYADITPFKYDYFDGYTVVGNQYSASMAKLYVVQSGALCLATPYHLQFLERMPEKGRRQPFFHPINHLFARLLDALSAQYVLLDLEQRTKVLADLEEDGAEESAEQEEEEEEEEEEEDGDEDEDEDDEESDDEDEDWWEDENKKADGDHIDDNHDQVNDSSDKNEETEKEGVSEVEEDDRGGDHLGDNSDSEGEEGAAHTESDIPWGAEYSDEFDEGPGSSIRERARFERLAALLKDHRQMQLLYTSVLQSRRWPAVDKVPDRMRKDYDPNEVPDLDAGPSNSGTQSHASVSSHIPPQLPPLPRMPLPQPASSGRRPCLRSSASQPGASAPARTSRKRTTLHNNDPFESSSSKRSATG